MKKVTLLIPFIALLFACNNNSNSDKVSESSTNTPALTLEQKTTIRNFISNRLDQLKDSIKKFPDNIKFLALKKVLTNKLNELK